MYLLHNSPYVGRKRAVFELLRKEAGDEIDYILPYITDVLNENVIFLHTGVTIVRIFLGNSFTFTIN
jgi:hypothetical protein